MSLVTVTLSEPATVLPPERVMVCTTPPWNRPYSAGTDTIETRVSSTASWMKNGRESPRVFSFAGSPSTRKRLPYENAPAITRALVGPLPLTPGAMSAARSGPRPIGVRSSASAGKTTSPGFDSRSGLSSADCVTLMVWGMAASSRRTSSVAASDVTVMV